MKTTTVTCDVCKGPFYPWTIETRDVLRGWCLDVKLHCRVPQAVAQPEVLPDVCIECAKKALRELVDKFIR